MSKHNKSGSSRREFLAGTVAATALAGVARTALAQGAKKEIRIGNIDAYSGPAAVYSAIGRTPGGYFKMINEQGGINGRMIKYIS